MACLAVSEVNIQHMKVTFIPIVISAFGTITKGLLKGLDELEVGEHPNYYIIENGQNTEKSPGELMRPSQVLPLWLRVGLVLIARKVPVV